MSAVVSINVYVQSGEWVQDAIIKAMFGFTDDQLKKDRSGQWLEEREWRKNAANRIVYNVQAINNWMAGRV